MSRRTGACCDNVKRDNLFDAEARRFSSWDACVHPPCSISLDALVSPGRRSCGPTRCPWATAGWARWCSAASTASGFSSTKAPSGPASRTTMRTRAHPNHLAKIRELLWAGKQKEAEDARDGASSWASRCARRRTRRSATWRSNFRAWSRRRHGVSAGAGSRHRHRGGPVHAGGKAYRREVFASYPANVIVVRLTRRRVRTAS